MGNLQSCLRMQPVVTIFQERSVMGSLPHRVRLRCVAGRCGSSEPQSQHIDLAESNGGGNLFDVFSGEAGPRVVVVLHSRLVPQNSEHCDESLNHRQRRHEPETLFPGWP